MGRRASALGVSLAVAVSCVRGAPPPPCEPPKVLEPAQRVRFLEYYAPILLKQADESELAPGRDWITNFAFDGDANFADNSREWFLGLPFHLTNGAPGWEIRPTVYSHLIEFAECSAKSVVLVYHVYHAMQINSIHDWERVEIRLDGVGAKPGDGEQVAYVVITEHKLHNARRPEAAPVRFLDDPPRGKHVLLWQAPWSFSLMPMDGSGPTSVGEAPGHATAELRFVETAWTDVDELPQSAGVAKVRIGGVARETTYHYLFAPEAHAVAGAQPLTQPDASALASRRSWLTPVDAAEVPRITYELQDTADIFVTHHRGAAEDGCGWSVFSGGAPACDAPCGGGRSWTCDEVRIELVEPMLDEHGTQVIAPGTHGFLERACDDVITNQKRGGYPEKGWFWGTYLLGRKGNFTGDAFGGDDVVVGERRTQANQCSGCLGDRWMQHDYFAHTGEKASQAGGRHELGRWLPSGWHLPANGGFDGRWVQLFADAPETTDPEGP